MNLYDYLEFKLRSIGYELRRYMMKKLIVFLLVIALIEGFSMMVSAAETPIPVIYDSDIGSDIDDTWALALILCSPELDLKLVVTDSHDTVEKAKIVAKFLEKVGRTDIPIGIGKKMDDNPGGQAAWAKNYELENYSSTIHEDGIQAMIDMINAANKPMTLIVVGPCPNIEIALDRSPEIVQKTRVIAMSGSVDKGYGNSPSPDAEYNVRDAISASQAMYNADWDLTIAPLDTAGLVHIEGEKYQNLVRTENPIINTLMENYKVWAEKGNHRIDPQIRSSTLFDTVAVYLAFDQSLCVMQDIRLSVDYKGYTVRDPKGNVIHCAMDWKNLDKFEDLIVERLIKGLPGQDKTKEESKKKK